MQAETAEIGDGYVTLVSDSNQLIPVYVDEEAEGAGGTVEQMMSDFSVGGTIMGLINDSGIYDIIKGNWKSAVMILISFVLLYLAIVKQFEPLLLMPIAFGMLLTNLPLAGIMDEPIYEIISNPTYHGKAGIPIYNGDIDVYKRQAMACVQISAASCSRAAANCCVGRTRLKKSRRFAGAGARRRSMRACRTVISSARANRS